MHMKVLMVEPLGFSGICYYTAGLCRTLQPLVEELTLLTASNYELNTSQEPYTVLPLLGGMNRNQAKLRRGFNALRNPLIMLDVIRANNPTIVHFQDSFIPLIEMWSVNLAHRLCAGVIYTVHDVERATLLGEPTVHSRLTALALHRIYHIANRLIVHSQNSADELQKRFTVDVSNIYQLPLGAPYIDNNSLPNRAEARASLNIPADCIVALFFGNLKKTKGLDYLLKALQRVVERLPNFLLLVAGPPRSENTTDYIGVTKSLGLEDYVRFDMRYIPYHEVPYYFIASDFVVLPYQKVYQSAVVVTAYAFGRPVVATRVDGLSEVVEDGRSGYLVDDSADVRSLADKIILMGLDQAKRNDMEHYVRELTLTRYSWTAIAKETKRIYSTLANE